MTTSEHRLLYVLLFFLPIFGILRRQIHREEHTTLHFFLELWPSWWVVVWLLAPACGRLCGQAGCKGSMWVGKQERVRSQDSELSISPSGQADGQGTEECSTIIAAGALALSSAARADLHCA